MNPGPFERVQSIEVAGGPRAGVIPRGAGVEPSMTELVQEAIVEARELVRAEVALARSEVREEIFRAKQSAVAFGIAAVAAIEGLALLFVALALAIEPDGLPALVIGLILLGIAAVAALVGKRRMPKKPLDETRHRLETDYRELKERVA